MRTPTLGDRIRWPVTGEVLTVLELTAESVGLGQSEVGVRVPRSTFEAKQGRLLLEDR